MVTYVSGGSEKNARDPRALDICISIPYVKVLVAIGYMTRTYLISIDGNLNADRYMSDILCPIVVLCYRGLPKVHNQRYDAKPHVTNRIPAYYVDT